jgi:hypothetical protein
MRCLLVGLLWLACGSAIAQTNPGVSPLPGIEIPAADRERLAAASARLQADIEAAAAPGGLPAALRERLVDVEIFPKAVSWAVELDEFYDLKQVAAAEALLAEGRGRLDALRSGTVPWTTATGLVVRGYRSLIDGSVQPYGLVVPEDRPAAGGRMDVWLHGRNDALTELAFLSERMRSRGTIAPPRTLVLHPYGRFCNAFKFAGETDVLEAIEHVKTLFPIDDTRTVIRGFSMGGAGCWQFAVHFPGRWLAATPGAGFAETREFLRTFQQQVFEPTAAQARLLHWYDCPDWANNLRHLPTIAYSGELDRQKQASDVMVAAAAARGFEIPHVIGPQTAHKIHPDAKAEIEAFVAGAAEQGRPAAPREIDFTTYTLCYPTHTWLTINGLGEHWREARVRAAVRSSRLIEITTTNVTALALDIPADAKLVDASDTVAVRIDGAVLDVPPASGPRWRAAVTKADGAWRLETAVDAHALRKRPGLQGPIDDAFMDAFMFVGPAPGHEAASPADRWVAEEFARAKREWRRHFRGDVVERLPENVSADDIATKHLVLFGTPESNPLVAKVLPGLPVKQGGEAWSIGTARSAVGSSLPVLVYPNPLNPERYVVWNSGFTYREYAYLNNARQIPMLPDWALVSTVEGRDSQLPGTILAEGFFDERWQP